VNEKPKQNEDIHMKKILLITTIFSLFQAPVLLASEQPERRPGSGLVTGVSMIAGVLMGGPGYVFVSTTLGAFYDRQADEKYRLTKKLSAQQTDLSGQIADYRNQITILGAELAERDAKYQLASNKWSGSISNLEKSIGYTLQFRTGSSAIEPHYIRDLTNLAELLKVRSGLRIELAGFSDRLGDETFNQQLSLDRVSRVENFFVGNGIKKNRIDTHAYGENQPLNHTSGVEDNSFERRVMISIEPTYKAVVSN
jgi:outer membrane protein OmpA-like peptidoglycan-associated protein